MYDNRRISAELREAADLLDGFRAAAFRRAAATVEASPRSMRELYERRGPAALEALPGVGRGIAGAIAEMLVAGRWKYLERLRREERSFTYTDEEGVEHDCVVLERRPKSALHGRDAIAALLGFRR
jgi:hypothetical protein